MKKTITYIILSLMVLCATAQELYIGSFYVTTTDEEKLLGDGSDKWANRMPVICDMLSFEQPDVVGLQSLTTSQLTSIVSRMKSTHAPAGDILYNKSALTLLDKGAIEDMPEGSTCTWAKLQKGERAFCVFNVCFSADASADGTSATRLISAIAEVNTESLPCFVVGNTGSSEGSTVYTRINFRYPDSYTKAAVISAEYGTVNNFDLAANHGSERYDFVFVPRTATVQAYGQLQYGYYTQNTDGTYKRRLPSAHFPVMAKVTLQ